MSRRDKRALAEAKIAAEEEEDRKKKLDLEKAKLKSMMTKKTVFSNKGNMPTVK